MAHPAGLSGRTLTRGLPPGRNPLKKRSFSFDNPHVFNYIIIFYGTQTPDWYSGFLRHPHRNRPPGNGRPDVPVHSEMNTQIGNDRIQIAGTG